MVDDLAAALFAMVEEVTGLHWPSERYRNNPTGFARDILGLDPWSKQIEIMESVRDHSRTSVVSGHRIGKSSVAAAIALWFYCSFEEARVRITAPKIDQVQDIIWRELTKLVVRSGRCLSCRAEHPNGPRPCEHAALIDSDELADLAKTGLVSSDRERSREVKGFTADKVESVTGIAGKNLLTIVDEAAGVDEAIYEGLEGNRAGASSDSGCVRVLLLGNGTRTTGEFYASHRKHKKYYNCIVVSSEETPNVLAGRTIHDGLATREWVAEKKDMWGEASALYTVRVKGGFAEKEAGKIFSVHTITSAEQRWPETPAEGRLWLGIDPSGESGMGDDALFVPRRGLKILELLAQLGLSPEAHVAVGLALIAKYGRPREKAVVVIDAEGSVGSKVAAAFDVAANEKGAPFELVIVRSSHKATRQPWIFDTIRDELTANLEGKIAAGLAIPEDSMLEAEMHVFEWEHQARGGKLKCTPKKAVKKVLGRSPDRYDAVALSCWEPLDLLEDAPESAKKAQRARDDDDDDERDDPYAHRGTLDPYAHRR